MTTLLEVKNHFEKKGIKLDIIGHPGSDGSTFDGLCYSISNDPLGDEVHLWQNDAGYSVFKMVNGKETDTCNTNDFEDAIRRFSDIIMEQCS